MSATKATTEWFKKIRVVDEAERKIISALRLYVVKEAHRLGYESELFGYDDVVYRRFRPQLEKVLKLRKLKEGKESEESKDIKKPKKTKVPPPKKADLLRLDHMVSKEEGNLTQVLQGNSHASLRHNVGLLLVMLMYRLDGLLKKEKDELPEREAYELIAGASRILSYVGNEKFKSALDNKQVAISELAIADTKYLLTKLIKAVHFDLRKVVSHYQNLVYTTRFDEWIPDLSIKPNECQIQLLDIFNHPKGALMIFPPPIGAGKTTSFIMLVERLIQTESKKQAIFCCDYGPVRNDMGLKAINSLGTIGFGLGTLVHGEPVVVKDPGSRRVNMVIADTLTTLALLRKDPDLYEVLFVDEPEKNLVDLIKAAPSLTILASASLEEHTKLEEMAQVFRIKYPEAFFGTITSQEIKTSYEIKSFGGVRFLPHHGCKTVEEVQCVIAHIRKNPFWGRTYDVFTVADLHRVIRGTEYTDLDVVKTNQSYLRDLTLTLLEELIQKPQDIAKICSAPPEVKEPTFSFDKLGTSDAWKFLGSGVNLVLSDEPQKDVKKYFSELIKPLDLKEILTSYQKDSRAYEGELKKRDKTVSKFKSENKEGEFMRQQSLRESRAPVYQVPPVFQIGTEEHGRKYYPKEKVEHFRGSGVNLPLVELEEMGVPLEILAYLVCGVGILDPEKLPSEYTSLVLLLSAQGDLPFLFSTDAISRGANLRIGRVIMTDEFATKRPMSSSAQPLGRAGRAGKTWRGCALVEGETLTRLSQELRSPLVLSTEIVQLKQDFTRAYRQLSRS